jgi:hypothetical protein
VLRVAVELGLLSKLAASAESALNLNELAAGSATSMLEKEEDTNTLDVHESVIGDPQLIGQ